MILDRLKKLELCEEEINKNAEVFDDIFLNYNKSELEKKISNNTINHTNNTFINRIKKICPQKSVKNLKIEYYDKKDNINIEYGKNNNKYTYKKNRKETITENNKERNTGHWKHTRTIFR
jgi:hypothetical protein